MIINLERHRKSVRIEIEGKTEEKEEVVAVKQLPPVVQWDWIFPDCFTPLIVPWALQM